MSTFSGSEFSFKSGTISIFFVIGFAVNSTRDSGQNTSILTRQLFIGSNAGENPRQLSWFQDRLSLQLIPRCQMAAGTSFSLEVPKLEIPGDQAVEVNYF